MFISAALYYKKQEITSMIKMNIGKSIQICLKEQDKNRDQGAEYLGVSKSWFSTISNHRNTGARSINELAEFFDMKPSEFISKGE